MATADSLISIDQNAELSTRRHRMLSPSGRLQVVARTMNEFAVTTGLSPPREPPRRYLWTDAFAVCNFLGLFSATRDETWLARANELVAQVHDRLGRFRADDPDTERRGKYLSGSVEHPISAGLRIGKAMAERREDEAFDERLEWERDGQYYHYLTKWMHALAQATRINDDARYARWAQELARGIHPGFIHGSGAGAKGMYWKISVDLSRPLVLSMGHHDPLDGFITVEHLTAVLPPPQGLDLRREIEDLCTMLAGRDWATNDPLGLGGILCDAYRVLQLVESTGDGTLRQMFPELLNAAARGLASYAQSHNNDVPADYRLAFREFGLTIGLQAAQAVMDLLRGRESGFGSDIAQLLRVIERHQLIRDDIDAFWSDPENQAVSAWIEHRDINTVMWATSLMPQGFLDLHL
jgi:hypothetical protein